MDYEELKREWTNESDYILCHTSGSTGTPAEIRLPKKEMIRSALRTAGFFGLDSSSHLHSSISPDFIGGKMMLVRSEVLGCKFSWETPSNRPLSSYEGERIDLLAIVPSQLVFLIDHPEKSALVRNILVGGGMINDRLRERVDASGLNVFESYGMTETSSHIAIRRVGINNPPLSPLPGIAVFLHEGCLGIRIAGWKDVITNDIADIDSQGNFWILGRKDNVIISGGKKIFPEKIERRLAQDLNFDFLISGLPDFKWGTRVVLYIGSSNRINSLSDEQIIRICHDKLQPYEVPKEIIRNVIFEYTPNGKIKRNSIKLS